MDSLPSTSKLAQMAAAGTSVWLDFVSRDLLRSGELARLIAADDVRGVTSNPAIFEKAIGHSATYDEELSALERGGDHGVGALFERLAVSDIQAAADVLRPVYERTGGLDGYISLEVSPYLAMDTARTVAEARRLWRDVARPNLMVKVPGTAAGVPAVAALIAEGININVTLLFAVSAYRAVADAYMAGLEALAAKGGDVARVASVASFFVSRIDGVVAREVAKRRAGADAAQAARLDRLNGTVAIANAKMAYAQYVHMVTLPRWRALAAKGAMPQRLLWASTGTKLPGLPDTLYVDTLIGPDTVNTMPPATMDAARDHAVVGCTLTQDLDGARAVLRALDLSGIPLAGVAEELVLDGVKQFADAADKLLGAVAAKRLALRGAAGRQTIRLPGLEEAFAAQSEAWRAGGMVRRLWARDAGVWTGTDEARWLGWLDLPDAAGLPALQAFQAEVKARGFADAVLLGMGGSSLGPEVVAEVLGVAPGFPRLHVVDSTDPGQLRAVRAAIEIGATLFIVSSKSGSTLEPNLFKDYFLAEALAAGVDPGRCFVAVTDPGSAMEAAAEAAGFWRVFHGVPSVGGRFSVLSAFGLVPAAALGVDLPAFVARAAEMARSCGADVPPMANPGVQLGLALGVCAMAGRDKATFFVSPGLAGVGAWLEQLIAESTGKRGRAIIPIENEPLGAAEAYGADRVIVSLCLDGETVAVPASAGTVLPLVSITVPTRLDVAAEFFRFEMATAVAGAVMGIDPFDQPDVEASKVATRALTAALERDGALPAETPVFAANGVAVFADAANVAALGAPADLVGYLRAHFGRVGGGDYIGVLAYVARDAATIAALQTMRVALRDATRVAVAAEFGPRFLHSTGQAYKGGPASGVFLQITCEDARDVKVPGKGYGFSAVKAAQARGDLQVLQDRGRRVLRLHLAETRAGLAAVQAALTEALRP